MSNKVCVLGSINVDMVFGLEKMPLEGETILSKSFSRNPGGKGANQAVAAVRSGADVYMIGKVGSDGNGQTMIDNMKKDGINVDTITIDKEYPTGMAIVMVNAEGNNSIVVEPGANMNIKDQDVEKADEYIKKSHIVISQFETPEESAVCMFKKAKEHNTITILNPAPAKKISDELLNVTDIIIPNETEVESITGIKVNDKESIRKAGQALIEKGVRYVIITLGEKGEAVISKDQIKVLKAHKVKAVDTTAAGDSFIGGFSAELKVNNMNFDCVVDACEFASRVSSLTVQKRGAQDSIPYKKDVIEEYGRD